MPVCDSQEKGSQLNSVQVKSIQTYSFLIAKGASFY